ncbi:MAG: DUF6268 family outer membrane beta-barrel protein [Polyangiaceae bacterium]|nr:DUF6268 family outer membrane beta-barrel protein [Polyangiaceae bacterium]
MAAPAAAEAQPLDLLELRSEYVPPTALGGDRPVGSAPWSDADDVQVSTYSVALNLPLALSDSTLLAAGIGYRLDKLSFSHESPAERALDLHAFELPLTLIQLLSSDWMLLFQAKPALASDLGSVQSRALRMQGLGLASYQFSDQFVLGGGAAAMFEFGSFLPLPVLHAQWEPTPQVKVEALLPLQAEAKLALGDRFEIGLRADVDGSSYAISDSAIRGSWPCKAEADDPATPQNEAQSDQAQCVDHVGYSVATAGATFGVRTFDSLWLTVYAARTFYRRFEQLNADNDRVAGGTQTLPNAFFARVGLTWRLPDGGDEDAAPQQKRTAGTNKETP